MCRFLSFKVKPTKRGLKLLFAHSLRSHDDIKSKGVCYEVEWHADEEIEIRLPEDEPEGKKTFLEDYLRNRFKTQFGLLDFAIRELDWSDQQLNLSCVKIDKLPEIGPVVGSLNLSNTEVVELPAGLKVVNGGLDISYTHISSLPKGLNVGDYLAANGSNLTELPEDLIVGRWLDISCTPISRLPESLKVGNSIYISKTNIKDEDVPEKFKKQIVR